MVTIQDIAKRVGISKAAVSLYLKDPDTTRVGKDTKVKIAKIVEELNYRPNVIARSLAMQKSNSIGILVPFEGPLFESTFMQQVISGIQSVLFAQGYSIVFLPVKGSDSRSMVRHQLEMGLGHDGFILMGTRYCSTKDMEENAKELSRTGIPFVVLNMPEMKLDINQVIYRDPPEINIFEQYYRLGHRDLVLIGGRRGSLENSIYIDQFKKTSKKWGKNFDSSFILHGDYDKDVAKSALLQYLKSGKKVTGIYCLTDTMAIGAYAAIQEFGLRIPEDISVVGRNDSFFVSIMSPPLSSVKRPIFDEGVKGAELLIGELIRSEKPRKVFLESTLVLRGSVQAQKV
jgi:LacI family transcriptional regulator